MIKLHKHLNLLRRSEDGVTALEFAFIVPVFMLIVMGIIEFSMIMFATTVMESATNNTARLGKTGYITPGNTREQEIINNINARTAGLLDPALLTLTSEVYSNFNNIDQPEPCISPGTPPCPGAAGVNFTDVNGNGTWDTDMEAAGYGNAGDVIVYTASYPWPIMTPVVSTVIGSTFTIIARTVVRNEPYD